MIFWLNHPVLNAWTLLFAGGIRMSSALRTVQKERGNSRSTPSSAVPVLTFLGFDSRLCQSALQDLPEETERLFCWNKAKLSQKTWNFTSEIWWENLSQPAGTTSRIPWIGQQLGATGPQKRTSQIDFCGLIHFPSSSGTDFFQFHIVFQLTVMCHKTKKDVTTLRHHLHQKTSHVESTNFGVPLGRRLSLLGHLVHSGSSTASVRLCHGVPA